MTEILHRTARSSRHRSFYLEAGPSDGPTIVFVHGWPELSTSWRHQITAFAALGFHVMVPDLRGYGRSSIPSSHADYAIEHIVTDMIELLDAAGVERAIWVGHDWGSVVVWNVASHHPDRCLAVASLCVPYIPAGWATDNLVPLVDRSVYPEAEYPAGQWEYWYAYKEDFDAARTGFERNVERTVKALFRSGDPAGMDLPEVTGRIRNEGGWGAFIEALGDLPMDEALLTREDLSAYVSSLERNGFFGPDSYYMNDDRNIEYARRSVDGGRISMPALFIAGTFDYTTKTAGTRLGDPMRAACTNLVEREIPSSHWMAQEKPLMVNAALTRWIVEQMPEQWPYAGRADNGPKGKKSCHG